MKDIFTVLAVSLTITLTGDILLDRGVRHVIERQGGDALFSPGIDSVLHTSDIVVGNLECPVTRMKAPVYKQFIFRGEPEWLTDLQRHGITHLNLANNHSIDQGREGLMDTRRNILSAGMVAIGAGANHQEACQPVLLADVPRHVWLLSTLQLALENFAWLPEKPCVSQERIDSMTVRIRALKQFDPQCYVIVCLHWGWENHTEVVPRQQLDAHRLIDAGADCVVGHHSHTLQATETYRGRPVYYGIGNFIFDPQRDINRRAGIVRLTIQPDTATAQLLPIVIKQCTPYLAEH